MPRPRNTLPSHAIQDELARLDEQRRALLDRHRAAEAAENAQRGEVILRLLRGPVGAELAEALARFVPGESQALFQAAGDVPAESSPTSARETGRRPRARTPEAEATAG